ncbi:MAG: hypothetical protein JXR85_00875, partial [Deltaproteobacteria bacterium]|nr:hypothetical protein [Deltaproteobacteria bacterium]
MVFRDITCYSDNRNIQYSVGGMRPLILHISFSATWVAPLPVIGSPAVSGAAEQCAVPLPVM